MSLTGSISNALSGLVATSRAAQLVSSNLANALTEGYSRRELELTASSWTNLGGVQVAGVRRVSDLALLADKRSAGADLGFHSPSSEAARSLVAIFGAPDDASSLSGHLSRFDSALRFAESSPESQTRLGEVVASASALVRFLGEAEQRVQELRTRADRQIGDAVQSLNATLKEVEQLNKQIVAANIKGHDSAPLLDTRQSLIDEISQLVPVREMPKSDGSVTLVTQSGLLLVEGSAVEIAFSETNLIMPHMTAQNGLLGSPSIDGLPIGVAGGQADLSGGRLAGLFAVRDTLLTQAQTQLDAFAFDLSERFNDLPADSSLAPGSAGLFTDAGGRTDALSMTGLSGRLELNAVVDPAQAGELWRLRDGLYAASSGSTGQAEILSSMIEKLGETRAGPGAFVDGNLFEHAAEMVSQLAQRQMQSDQSISFASARHEQFQQRQLELGVDTDAELQKLLAIETNYAANAKVLQTVDEMMNSILRMT